MKKFKVGYSLHGEIEIEAKDERDAIEFVEAMLEGDMMNDGIIEGLYSSMVGDAEGVVDDED